MIHSGKDRDTLSQWSQVRDIGATSGAGMLHLRELQVLRRVCVVEREDREVVGKLACN